MRYSFFLVFFLFVISCSENKKRAIVSVNSDLITLDLFKKRYADFLENTMQSDNLQIRYAFLNSLIDEQLFLVHAKEINIESDENLKLNKQKIFDQLLLNAYYDFKISDQHAASEKELRRLFSWSNMQCHIRHLYAPTREKILKIEANLDKGIEWESLASQCFRDSILKNNGGDIGWIEIGDTEPSFEFAAFNLKDGEISKPIKTKTGYSIIQRLESVYEGILTEELYKKEKKDLIFLANSYHKHFKLIEYTNEVIQSLNIIFDEDALKTVFNILYSPNFNGEVPKNKVLVSFQDDTWTIEDALERIVDLSDRQLKRIRSIENFEEVIGGLICRSYFFKDAKKEGLHSKEGFAREYAKLAEQENIRYVMNSIKRGVDMDDPDYEKKLRKTYFDFRNSLLNRNSVSVDSLQLKNFIL